MRTTLTLEEDVARRVEEETRRRGKSLKRVINEALRTGLGMTGKPDKLPRFRVEAHAFGFKPGVDLDKLNQLVDELESAEAAAKLDR